MNNFVQVLYKNGVTEIRELEGTSGFTLKGIEQEYIIIKMVYGNVPIVHQNLTEIEKILCTSEFFDFSSLNVEDFKLWPTTRSFPMAVPLWKYIISADYATQAKQTEIINAINISGGTPSQKLSDYYNVNGPVNDGPPFQDIAWSLGLANNYLQSLHIALLNCQGVKTSGLQIMLYDQVSSPTAVGGQPFYRGSVRNIGDVIKVPVVKITAGLWIFFNNTDLDNVHLLASWTYSPIV